MTITTESNDPLDRQDELKASSSGIRLLDVPTHRFVMIDGSGPIGRYHELYLGDSRRSAPERLRTILRQPVG